MRRTPHAIILAIFAISFLVSCSRDKAPALSAPTIEVQYPIMGTFAEIKIYGDPVIAKSAADAVRREFEAVESTCSRFNSESELSKLNATAFETPFKCSDLLWEVLMESKYFYEFSNGSFDITITPLMELWGFYRKQNTLPSQKEILEAREKVGLDKVIFDEKNKTVSFTMKGLSFDLGGIAKGFAVDKAAEAAIKLGAKAGTINLGGNLRCLPEAPSGRDKYTIGVRHPIRKDEICGTVDVFNSSLATSGNYEKYVIIDGVRYTHIMDPATGQPVKHMLSVTVISPKAVLTDGLSTSIFIKGEDFARKACEKIPGTSVIIIINPADNPEKVEVIKIGDLKSSVTRVD